MASDDTRMYEVLLTRSELSLVTHALEQHRANAERTVRQGPTEQKRTHAELVIVAVGNLLQLVRNARAL